MKAYFCLLQKTLRRYKLPLSFMKDETLIAAVEKCKKLYPKDAGPSDVRTEYRRKTNKFLEDLG